jgi:hypothetical protein
MEIEAKVGPQQNSDGSKILVRGGRTGALNVADAHGKYTELATRGLIFSGATASAGIAHGTALTATPPLALANPSSSGVNLSILRATMGIVSGTLGIGTLWWVAAANAVAGLPAESSNAFRSVNRVNGAALGTAGGSSQGRIFSNVSLTTSPVLVRPTAISYTAMNLASIATALPVMSEETAGAIVVPPGFWVALQGIGTSGTTPLVQLGIEWEEIPV